MRVDLIKTRKEFTRVLACPKLRLALTDAKRLHLSVHSKTHVRTSFLLSPEAAFFEHGLWLTVPTKYLYLAGRTMRTVVNGTESGTGCARTEPVLRTDLAGTEYGTMHYYVPHHGCIRAVPIYAYLPGRTYHTYGYGSGTVLSPYSVPYWLVRTRYERGHPLSRTQSPLLRCEGLQRRKRARVTASTDHPYLVENLLQGTHFAGVDGVRQSASHRRAPPESRFFFARTRSFSKC